MELKCETLDGIISNETLDGLIQHTTSHSILKDLLKIKLHRYEHGTCKKLSFLISSSMYTLNVDILRLVLDVTTNSEAILQQTAGFCAESLLNQQPNDRQNAFKLLDCIVGFCDVKTIGLEFLRDYSSIIQCGVVDAIRSTSKELFTLVTFSFLPKYLRLCIASRDFLLKSIFDYAKKSEKVDTVCVLHEHFAFNNFSAVGMAEFLLLLEHCIASTGQLQKQGTYLLSKTIKVSNIVFPSKEHTKAWDNFFILLDVVNEQRMHLIAPSLPLLKTIGEIPFSWRRCLYKKFLKHAQNAVVYSVAIFILREDSDWENFALICKDVLTAINKHEFNQYSQKFFVEFGAFTDKLEDTQFEFILKESRDVGWTPVAFFLFCDAIFGNISHRIPVNLLEIFLQILKHLPHQAIRNGCTLIIYKYLTRYNFYSDYSADDYLKFLFLLLETMEFCVSDLFDTIKEETLQGREHEFIASIANDSWANCRNAKYVRLLAEILKKLKVTELKRFKQMSNVTIYYYSSLSHRNEIKIEKFVNEEFESLKTIEDIELLVSIFANSPTQNTINKMYDILLENTDTQYNTMQTIAAFKIIFQRKEFFENQIEVYKLWMKKITSQIIDDRIILVFIEQLREFMNAHFKNNKSPFDDKDVLCVFRTLFEQQNETAVALLKDPRIVLNFGVNEIILNQLFETVWSLSQVFSLTVNNFLESLEGYTMPNENYHNQMIALCCKIMESTSTSSKTAFHIAKNLHNSSHFTSNNSSDYLRLLVELILSGYVVKTNEKIEYFIGQRIRKSGLFSDRWFQGDFGTSSTRLYALDTLLGLLATQHSRNVQRTICTQLQQLLLEQYDKYYNKRYFPNSEVHLHKVRIIQVLLLIEPYLVKKQSLVELLIGKYLVENHQASVKLLLQWLLIKLLKDDDNGSKLILSKVTSMNNCKNSTICTFIPILYHLSIINVVSWDEVVAILVPWTMGPQFKIRLFSQVALMKMYEAALANQNLNFLSKYSLLKYIKDVVNATSTTFLDETNKYFVDYFSIDFTTIYYVIPQATGVGEFEWPNISSTDKLNHIVYTPCDFQHSVVSTLDEEIDGCSNNIQKKITLWKDVLEKPLENNFILVTTLIKKVTNLGGLCRTCEVFGVKEMVVHAPNVIVDKEFESLSMSAGNWVEITEVKLNTLTEFLLNLKQNNYSIVGAEHTAASLSLEKFKFAKKTCLLLGHEKEGIPPNIIPLLDYCVEIPQFGVIRSLNVHVAGAVVLWEYCKQHKLG